jgi:hypothetical protein
MLEVPPSIPSHTPSRHFSQSLNLKRSRRQDVRAPPKLLIIVRPSLQIGVQAGGIFVNQEVLRQLRRRFIEAQIPEDEMEGWLRIAEVEFERSLKMEFPRSTGRHTITVDRESYNNRVVGIKNGRLSLTM